MTTTTQSAPSGRASAHTISATATPPPSSAPDLAEVLNAVSVVLRDMFTCLGEVRAMVNFGVNTPQGHVIADALSVAAWMIDYGIRIAEDADAAGEQERFVIGFYSGVQKAPVQRCNTAEAHRKVMPPVDAHPIPGAPSLAERLATVIEVLREVNSLLGCNRAMILFGLNTPQGRVIADVFSVARWMLDYSLRIAADAAAIGWTEAFIIKFYSRVQKAAAEQQAGGAA